MKVVINKCYGGFSLSKEANELYAKRKNLNVGTWNGQWMFYENGDFYDREIARNDPTLIEIIEEIGVERASGGYAKLAIVTIPDGVEWEIDEYDGWEKVVEAHRSWS